MSFYQSIARYYDRIFPLEDNQLGFVQGRMSEQRGAFLDIGCATGNLVKALAGYFDISIGIDLDDELIRIAGADAADRQQDAQNVLFLQKNMLDIDLIDKADMFSLITCLGNTIPHLSTIVDIQLFHRKVFQRLAGNGVYIMQMINFDRILDHRISTLPAIETDTIRFERNYSLMKPDNTIDFMTELTDKTTGHKITNTIPLFPVRKKEMLEVLEYAGFNSVDMYGSFDSVLYADDAYLLIAVCRK